MDMAKETVQGGPTASHANAKTSRYHYTGIEASVQVTLN